MENKPKVSVIFPIYNNEKYLERCIRSVMNQTLKEIELILIDDGSKDSAPDICDKLAKEDERICVVHKKNEGSAAGRNQGIEMARGEYIAFVESDDMTAEDMYEKLYKRAIETNADIVKCGFYFCENGKRNEANFFYKIAAENEVFTITEKPEMFMYHASMWAAIYKRDFINEKKLRCIVTPSATYSDFSWMAMTYAYANRITILHESLYFYTFDNPDSSWHQEGEKVFYKPFHCMEANRILREAGVFDTVKEIIGFAEYRTCLGHARDIRPELRKTYFEKYQALMKDVSKDGLQYSRFPSLDKRNAKLIIGGDYNKFYRVIDGQIRRRKLMKKLERNRLLKSLIRKIKNLKRNTIG